jgi:nucleotide-binding universal stress UspA family protein
MTIRNLLLAFSGEAAFASPLSHAVKLAQHHDAWLTAIMRNGQSFFERLGAGLTPALRAQLRQLESEDVQAAMKRFQDAVREAGVADRAQFIPPEQMGATRPSELARSYDLIVTGFRSDVAAEEHHVVSADLLALRSGRPVLVVPADYSAPALAENVLVAWDGKRAAARALGDAMSLLEGKRRVTILTVGAKPPPVPADGGVLRHLERHGIDAGQLHRVPQGGSIASVIKNCADEVGARLIVMGAYEHSKLSQDMFGGVTHEVLRSARVPIFMSH